MGSFNKIGFVSSLPILSGDETVLVFMIPNKYNEGKNSGVCYSTDWFEPAFLPVYGVYDDYGRIENVQDTKAVKFIENFFGIDIMTMIEEVDDNAVGRGGKKCTAIRNKEIYEKLTFGLELARVYEKMASYKRLAYHGDGNTQFWLEKMGFTQIENNTISERYKYTWVHPDIPGFQYHSDRSHGHLFNLSTGKEHSGYTFHPSYLENEMSKISKTYKSNLTEDDKQLCSVDLSVTHTKLAIFQYEKTLTGDAREDFRKSLVGIKRYNGYSNLTEYLKKCHIDGTCYDFDASRQPKELLSTVTEKEIADFIRFFLTISHLNAKFQPSNYGTQDQDFKIHYEMLKCYRDCVKDKMLEYSNSNYYDNDDDVTYILNDIKSEDRDDKILEILI